MIVYVARALLFLGQIRFEVLNLPCVLRVHQMPLSQYYAAPRAASTSIDSVSVLADFGIGDGFHDVQWSIILCDEEEKVQSSWGEYGREANSDILIRAHRPCILSDAVLPDQSESRNGGSGVRY